METFGRTTEFINHPGLMPDLYKDLDDNRHTAMDKQCQQSQLGTLPQVTQKQCLTTTICNHAKETL